jgi:hypothetical protein
MRRLIVKTLVAILLFLPLSGCVKSADYGAVAGLANVVVGVCVVGILLFVWVRRMLWRRSIARNFENEFKRDKLAILNARIEALQALMLAIAKTSPQSDEIRAQFAAMTEERRKFFESSPLGAEGAKDLMGPFDNCLYKWKS